MISMKVNSRETMRGIFIGGWWSIEDLFRVSVDFVIK